MVAVSICTLSAFCQAHQTCPCFTIQAQCKTLCHLHHMPYHLYLCTQFSWAFDVYLEIIHHVEQHVHKALEHNMKDWQLLNACPPYFYQLQDKPKLDFDWLVSIDGNNSLKQWDKSHYGTVSHEDHCDDWEMEILPNFPSQFNCVDQWQNAGPEQCKKMFSVFREAKYPLAIVNRLLSVYGANGGCAYDIGVLRLTACSLNLCFMVGTFHSHAHNWKCQIDWHPMYIQGTGNTKGEGCKYVFSSSIELAWGTHHSSCFHWHQAIEQHFAFWNEDKYEALTQFICNHYQEATDKIQ
ncbi:hypothetical protein PAXRUDRAFT_35987 [Paxillus rubicundulus Ve08.2h10]|uniref:Unplaced genomic scaffold scaffold_1049, whole genome shotgun sequence n=1 Tax=Paxillus rubicundulus Ve08.2h10 TaxID=930991 RepID=A0A0D0CEF2_9AGAM|nr:hypothetical protein PAXRUDRAFT_35987 [Paxillus rubicundulus Ve08.2h10]